MKLCLYRRPFLLPNLKNLEQPISQPPPCKRPTQPRMPRIRPQTPWPPTLEPQPSQRACRSYSLLIRCSGAVVISVTNKNMSLMKPQVKPNPMPTMPMDKWPGIKFQSTPHNWAGMKAEMILPIECLL